MAGTTLLLIDIQKDFHPGGSLAIPTADQDAERIAALVRDNVHKIDRVIATLDSHQKLHLAHPSFWVSRDDNAKHPEPFTTVSADELEMGIWVPRKDLVLPKDESGQIDSSIFLDIGKVQNDSGSLDLSKYCIEYARRLEAKGRFKLCIWPEHCLIGSPGHGLVEVVRNALDFWSETTGKSVEWVMKGQNLLTEMYSVLEADVPVSKSTTFNEELQAQLLQSDRLIVCGQAMSHCVNYTLRDIVSRWPADIRSRIFLVTDCASAVPGFESAAESFCEDMEHAGICLTRADNVFV